MSSTPEEANGIYLEEMRLQVFNDLMFCKECEYCEKTKDGFGTGDSPTLYECTGTYHDCRGIYLE
jgi:hypothetical protein